MTITCCLSTGAVIFIWLAVRNVWGIILIVILYGFISGGLVSLPPATIAVLSKNPEEIGTRVGMAFTICSFGALVGNPIAGALLPNITSEASFARPWVFAGGTVVIAGLLVSLTAYLKNRASRVSGEDAVNSARRGSRLPGLAREAFLMQSTAFAL